MELSIHGKIAYAATDGRAFDAARPTIVFIHGAGLDHTCWQLQSRWFAWHGWSAMAVDLPAHGRSEGPPLSSIEAMSDWVLAATDAAGVEKAALVGHSMGAVIALETAARMPERVTGLGLLGISSAMPVHPALLAAARDAPERAYDMMTGWCFANAAKLGGNTAPGMWMTGGARALLGRGRETALAADLAACNAWTSATQSAAAVKAPTVLVLGAEDLMTPARKGQELAKLIPGAACVTLPRCGHMMMQEKPDATLDALIAHFGARD
ncbi:MAG: alpha/beta hydrolase [Hyphomicrobiaceae bacterium]|nr:alpha/beta hydrolase [Hyphomicrobiaceae bacterium]